MPHWNPAMVSVTPYRRIRSAAIAFLTGTAVQVAAQPIPDSLLFHSLPLPVVAGSNLTCNDGTPYKFFYRNCTGNWDRHAGDPDFCNVTDTRWVLVFSDFSEQDSAAGSGAFCYDARSCGARQRNLTTSLNLPPTAWANGVVTPFAEVNPNLYLQHSVLAPHCSSDMFAGGGGTARVGDAAWTFSGARIVDAVLNALFSPSALPPPTAAAADTIVIVGGAGIMARIDELAARLRALKNGSGSLAVFGVCDGCLQLEVAGAPTPPLCTLDSDCPPPTALPLLASLSGGLVRPAWCSEADVWRCYMADTLLPFLRRAATPVLLLEAQYSERALASYGLSIPLSGTGLDWAQSEYAPAVIAALKGANYSVSVACAASQQAAQTLSSAYWRTLTSHEDSFGHTHNDSFGTAVPLFLQAADQRGEGGVFGTWGDDCSVMRGCNPSGCAE